MVGTKKERVWNDPPLPGDPERPVPVVFSNIPPEVKAFFRAMMIRADLSRFVYGFVIAASYTGMYWVTITYFPEITQNQILWAFAMLLAFHALYNIIYITKKYG